MKRRPCTAWRDAGRAHFPRFPMSPVLCLLLCGCVHALRPYNEPSQQKLRIQSSAPQQYAIPVADNAPYSVPADGRVIVDVPQLARGCATYLLGMKVSDGSPNDIR